MRPLYVGVVSALIALQADGQTKSEPSSIFVSFKEKLWTLQIAAPGFLVTENVTQADGRQYLLATNDSSGYTLSVTLEKISGEATLDGCREGFRARTQPGGPFQLADIDQSQLTSMPILEYMIPEANHVAVKQKKNRRPRKGGCVRRHPPFQGGVSGNRRAASEGRLEFG